MVVRSQLRILLWLSGQEKEQSYMGKFYMRQRLKRAGKIGR